MLLGFRYASDHAAELGVCGLGKGDQGGLRGCAMLAAARATTAGRVSIYGALRGGALRE